MKKQIEKILCAEVIDSGMIARIIEDGELTPLDDAEVARRSLTRRGYKLIGRYRKPGQVREVWEKRGKNAD